MEFFATCSKGFEKILGDELRKIGVEGVRPLTGGVNFTDELSGAYRALLWSRLANRILLTLDRVSATDADALYEGVKAIPWEEHLPQGGTIAVDARGVNAKLRDTRFTGLKVKDAICDRLRELWGERPSVDTEDPFLSINVLVSQDRATVSLDLSGAPLDQRGYRCGRPAGAPLRETLAASSLVLAGWPRAVREGGGLLNPFCGTGAIAIEAALMAADVAPGISRTQWGFNRWLKHDQDLWDSLIDEADSRAEAGTAALGKIIYAAESDKHALAYAQSCAKRAGVSRFITFFESEEEMPQLEEVCGETDGLLLANISGSTQFSSLAQLPALCAGLSVRASDDKGVSTMALLVADDSLDAFIPFKKTNSCGARNGASDVLLKIYNCQGLEDEAKCIEVAGQQLYVNDPNVEQFAFRLTKMAKERRKWAQKNGVSAYRVYDADLPDYNLALDVYEGASRDTGRTLIHVNEYAAPKKIDPAKASRRMNDALAVIPLVMGVDPSCVFVKRRVHAKGGSQYAESAATGRGFQGKLTTQENGLLFKVDLGGKLDTGLFLDHRDTRQLLRKLACGKSFLNLFAYTGSATVYAAAGKAKFTTTVDMSNTYLNWAEKNMELNGFTQDDHHFVRADVLSWIRDKRHTRERWDLIFVDPPTFSNSSKMGNHTWDVQKDHAELLIQASRLLTRNGAIMFSCNLRSFKPDAEKLKRAGVVMVDITSKTIPDDFARHAKVHHCYLLRRG